MDIQDLVNIVKNTQKNLYSFSEDDEGSDSGQSQNSQNSQKHKKPK